MVRGQVEARDYDPNDPPRFGEWVRVQGQATRSRSRAPQQPHSLHRWLPVLGAALLILLIGLALQQLAPKKRGALSSEPPPAPSHADRAAAESTVLVRVTRDPSTGATFEGTGFCLEDRSLIVTSGQVVPLREMKPDGTADLVPQSKVTVVLRSGESADVELLYANKRQEIAIFRLLNETLKPLKIGEAGEVSNEEQCQAIGFPGVKAGTGSLDVPERSIQPVVLGRREHVQDQLGMGPRRRLENTLEGVMAGGPIINASGRVVGMVTRAAAGHAGAQREGLQASGVSYAITSGIIKTAMKKTRKEARKQLRRAGV